MVEMPKNLKEFSKDDLISFLNSFDTVLCDCDDVLWVENKVIGQAECAINKFKEMGKKVFFVTNNSTKTREELLEKCKELGFNVDQEDIICTSYLAANYLKSLNFEKKVYVIGSGITKELDKFGIKHTESGPDVLATDLETYVHSMLGRETGIGAVLVGFDEHFSYPKMIKAYVYLNDPKCLFIATNTDERLPITPTLVMPGTGSMVRCLETFAGRTAFVLGKPNDYIRDAVMQQHNIDPARTLMIGDRSNTDIVFGKKCGFQTLLVLTGVTTLSEVADWARSENTDDHGLVPEFYLDKLGDIISLMA